MELVVPAEALCCWSTAPCAMVVSWPFRVSMFCSSLNVHPRCHFPVPRPSDDEDGGGGGGGGAGGGGVEDKTEVDIVTLRRTIYLTIMSALDFEETCHKLMKLKIPDGLEVELINMVLECCSQVGMRVLRCPLSSPP